MGCTPGDTTASLSGVSYPTTIECCQTDECNRAGTLKGSFNLYIALILGIACFFWNKHFFYYEKYIKTYFEYVCQEFVNIWILDYFIQYNNKANMSRNKNTKDK